MRVLTNTNIIVDDFDYCKNFPKGTFVHFLSHFHADHYFGMSTCWDYGPIYCSKITKQLILSQFTKIPNITVLELNTKHTITIRPGMTVDVYLFDSNHIPGSVLFLFQGYMGTILHTGDMRFRDSMITDNPILYPPEKRTPNNIKCSIHIDELVFDNTYLNPAFNFPTRDKACQMMIDIIEKNKGKRCIIAMGTLGKEEMMLHLSEYFQTLIVIPEKKMKLVEAMGYRTDIFTIHPEQGWIEIISKKHRLDRLEEEKALGHTDFIMVSIDFLMFEGDLKAPDGINYLVPYSQHSNYQELEKFVKSICPSVLRKLVVPYLMFPEFKNRPIDNIGAYFGYMKNLKRDGTSTYREFLIKYSDIVSISADYQKWMKPTVQTELMAQLGLSKNANPALRRTRKKGGLEKDLDDLLPGANVNELHRMYFPNQIEKKKSLMEISEHMMAVNGNKNLTEMFKKDKKVKKTPLDSQDGKKYGKACSVDDVYTGCFSNSVEKREENLFNPSEDDELRCLMDKFLHSNSNPAIEMGKNDDFVSPGKMD